jgi:methyl-accepting chemotaxis protein
MRGNNVLGDLRLSRKFLIFAMLGVLLVAAPLGAYLRQSNEAIAVAQLEKDGLRPSQQLLLVVQQVQHHRGLSANALGNTATLAPQRVAKGVEVQAANANFAATVKASIPDLTIIEAWRAAEAEWKSLEQAVTGRTIDGAVSHDRHTALIAKLLDMLDLLADYFGLSLDPAAGSYHMMMATLYHMPLLSEVLSQGNARGTHSLSSGDTLHADARVELVSLAGLTKMHYRNMARALEKAIATNTKLSGSLGGIITESQKLYEQALKLTREQLIDATTLSYAGADYHRAYTEVVDGQFKLNAQEFHLLEEALIARINDLRMTQLWILGAVLLVSLLAAGFGYAVTRAITRPLAQAVVMAEHVAGGDLTRQAVHVTKDEIGCLLQALETMRAGLAVSVFEIRAAADSVGAASGQIAKGNSDLSMRTEEQASGLEETASSMEELTATVKQNADSAGQANLLAMDAATVATRGGVTVRGAVSTMQGIAESSKRITDIIGVIDGIAFQTNILALNAAVEAARAGEQGRGFAVVAAEVRALAQRSAQASKEIKNLIQESTARVNAGVSEVEGAGTTMSVIVDSVNKVNALIAEIAGASKEQLSGIETVNRAVAQIDTNTQQNAAVVEQAAAAAEHMAAQAQLLMQTVAKFKLEAEFGTEPAPARAVSRVVKAFESVAPRQRSAVRPPMNIAALANQKEWKEF